MGEAFRLTLELRDAGGAQVEPTLPREFEIVGQSSQTSFSFGTGRGAERVSRFVYSVVGTAAGKYELGPFSVTIKGKKVVSGTVKIQVLEQANGNAKNSPKAAGRDIFLTTSLNKKEVWVGESFVLSIKFYFRVSVSSSSLMDADFSQFVSFDGKDVPQTESRETVNGVEYNVIEVKKTYAARSHGTFSLPAVKLQTEVPVARRQRDASGMDSPFDQFNEMFADPFLQRTERKIVSAPPLSLTVRPLPEPKPSHFSGVVGDVKISSQISKTELVVGENATLTVRAEGVADLSGMVIPDLGAGENIKAYADKPVLNSERDAHDGIRQVKIFTVGVVPTAAGTLAIPERAISVFNPQTSSYEERQIPRFELRVSGSSDTGAAAVAPSADNTVVQKSVQERGNDIFPPRALTPSIARDDRMGVRFLGIWFVVPTLLALIWVVAFARARMNDSSPDSHAHAASRKAFSNWKKDLAKLKAHVRQGGGVQEIPVEEILAKAVRRYLEHRLSAGALAMTSEELRTLVIDKGCKSEVAQNLSDLVSRLDMGRYAGGTLSGATDDVVSAAEKIVAEIEKGVR